MDQEDHTPDTYRIDLDARDWVVRLTSGEVSEAELEAFKAWRDCRPEHGAAFARESLFWRQLQAVEPVKVSPPPVAARSTIGRRGFLIGGAGATAAGLLLAPRLHRWWSADFIAPIGKQADISLPDGSRAVLNSGSALRVAYGPDLRLVVLTEGEAEFSVAAAGNGIPFRLATLGGNTDMRVGRFSARLDEETATIAVAEEQALVFGPAEERASAANFPAAITLGRNEQTTYRLGDAPKASVPADLDVALAWRQNKVIFEGKAFSGAVTELGRYLREPVVLRPGIDHGLPVSGVFSTLEPLDALKALARTQALAVRRVPGVAIFIT